MAGFDSDPLRVYLLRHGEALGNVQGGYYGRTDCPLTAKGCRQAERAGATLRELRAAGSGRDLLLLTSPLERARHTAEIVREAAGLDGAFLFEPDWQEIDFGRWEKRHYQDIAREEPAAWQSLCDDWQAFCYPQGESFRMFAERVIGAWQKWQQAAAREEKDLLVVSHGGVLKVIRLFAEARPWEDFWQLDISLGEVQLMSLPVR